MSNMLLDLVNLNLGKGREGVAFSIYFYFFRSCIGDEASVFLSFNGNSDIPFLRYRPFYFVSPNFRFDLSLYYMAINSSLHISIMAS